MHNKMKLEGIAQKTTKRMEAEGKVKYAKLFGYKYIKKIEEVKDNFVQELRENGITFSMTLGDDPPSYRA
jgi:hypothetical protein